MTRTGKLLPFKRGLEKIVEGLDVRIIPVHLEGLWGSIFSFEGGRFFWKWPRQMPHPVTISFGKPMAASSTANDVRQAIQDLAAEGATACGAGGRHAVFAVVRRGAGSRWIRGASFCTTTGACVEKRVLRAAAVITC